MSTISKMGCTGSTPKVYESRHRRKSTTESKITKALLKKKMEHAVSDKPISFEKILLRFDKLRVVLGYVKTIFNEIAVDGKLDNDGLQAAMKRLEVNLTLEEFLDLFDFIDVQESHVITIKEFLVALTIGMVLDVIPAFQNHPPSEVNPKPPIKRSFSGLLGHNHEIREMLNLIVSAYLIFDPDGKGFIDRKNVEQMLDEHGQSKKSNNVMLSQQRWNEMVCLKFG